MEDRNCARGRVPQTDCGCVNPWVVAMAYVPWQTWNQVYELQKALCTGTIFPDLDKPFCGVRGGCR